jgi:hypothetical protein
LPGESQASASLSERKPRPARLKSGSLPILPFKAAPLGELPVKPAAASPVVWVVFCAPSAA